MEQDLFKRFEKGHEVYLVDESGEKLAHLQGVLQVDITAETKEIVLLNPDGEQITVGSEANPEWDYVEAFEGFDLLFVKEDIGRVKYIIVSKEEDGILLEPNLD